MYEPMTENMNKQDYTSMFFNKYCEDTNLPSVCNRYADVVIECEKQRNILSNEEDDFDIEEGSSNDETLNESQEEITIEETLPNISKTHDINVIDEVHESLDMFFNPTEDETEILAHKAGKQKKTSN